MTISGFVCRAPVRSRVDEKQSSLTFRQPVSWRSISRE